VTATEEVMAVILRHFASSVALVDTPEQASDLYFEAALLPRSATRIVLQQQGISVAEVFRGSDPSKAVLLYAHENGTPRILKIATEKSILHECEVWSAVEATNQQSDAYLVPIKKCLFESATVDIGDISGGSSTHPAVRCGILMKHYQGTLSQCKIPLTVEVLLRYGQYLHKAVSTLHQAGYCHLDIKPSNIFLFEEACYLGDYGAAAKTGDPIHERTIKYYPKDGNFEAKEETDMYLLAATLLEVFGAIPQASSQRNDSFTKQEIHEYITTVESKEVQDFLSSLFIGE
jgi:serine/threonine protein kinase